MDLKLSILLIAIFAVFAKADDLQCTGCLCAAADDSTTFARGDTATLCVHFMAVNGTTGEIVAQRAAYPIAVDTFSAVPLQGGQGTFLPYGYVAIAVQAHGQAMSTPLTYSQSQIFYSSVFSIVIQISSGVIKSVVWDHRCSTCDSDDCYQFSMTNGTLIDTICNNQTCQSTTDSSCDPQVYISWVGSDKNGVKMTSAGTRLSRFRQFSTSELLSSKTIPRYVVPTPSNQTDTDGSNSGTGTDTGSDSGSSSGDNSSSGSGSGSGNSSGTETGSSSSEDTHSSSGDSTGTSSSSGEGTHSSSGEGTETASSSSEDTHSGTSTSESTSSGESTHEGTTPVTTTVQ